MFQKLVVEGNQTVTMSIRYFKKKLGPLGFWLHSQLFLYAVVVVFFLFLRQVIFKWKNASCVFKCFQSLALLMSTKIVTSQWSAVGWCFALASDFEVTYFTEPCIMGISQRTKIYPKVVTANRRKIVFILRKLESQLILSHKAEYWCVVFC